MTMGAQDGPYRRVARNRSVSMIALVESLDERRGGDFFFGTATDRRPRTATLPPCQPIEDRQSDHGHKEEGKDQRRADERGVETAGFPVPQTGGPGRRRCRQADRGNR